MTTPTLAITAGFVALLVGTEAFFTGLSVLNLRHAERAVEREREFVESVLGVADPDELLEYQRVTTGFGRLRAWIGVGALVLVVPTGLLGDAVAALGTLGLGPVAEGVVFVLGTVALLQLVTLPFDAVDTFVVESVFGFNRQHPGLWLRDAAVGLAVSLAITAPLAAAVLWLLAASPTVWWVGAWAVLVAFSFAMLVIYPRFVAPLFNDFEPIEGGELRAAVDEVFERAGFACERVYEMDASRRSSHSNAYFVGFGRTKRVVLFDTLIEQLTIDELQGVLAHELSHWKRAHVWKLLGATAVRTGVVLGVLAVLVDGPWLYDAFGLPADAAYAGLAVGVLIVEPLLRFTAPLENALSLRFEREADRDAVDVMGGGEPMVGALSALASENLSNPFPHPWYATFHYSHPPIPERIRRIRELGGGGEASDTPRRGGGAPDDLGDSGDPDGSDVPGAA